MKTLSKWLMATSLSIISFLVFVMLYAQITDKYLLVSLKAVGRYHALDLLDRTLELPLKSKIVTQPYVDFLAHQYRLSHNGFHGIEHWLRVLINGRLIAAEVGADIEVVEHFALLHDVMREDENTDFQHGNRAADFVKLIAGDWIH